MPHLIVEYSANLGSDIDIAKLIRALHETAVSIDALPTGGIRTRAAKRDVFLVADGHPDNGFINVTLRIAEGRAIEVRKETGQALFDTLANYVQEVYDSRPMSLSFEIQEIHPETRWKQGNIRDYMAQRANQDETCHSTSTSKKSSK